MATSKFSVTLRHYVFPNDRHDYVVESIKGPAPFIDTAYLW